MTNPSDFPFMPSPYPLVDGLGPRFLTGTAAKRRLPSPAPGARVEAGVAALPPDPPTPAPSSSVNGQIQRMLLAISDEIAMSAPLWPVFQAIIIQMPNTAFVVLVEEEARQIVSQWLTLQGPVVNGRVTLVDWQQNEDGDPPLTGWVQDPFIPAVYGGQRPPTQLLVPQGSDDPIPIQLAADQALELERAVTPVAFEGGNLLFDAGRYCIGLDTIDQTQALITNGTIPPAPHGVGADGYITNLYHRYVDGTRDPCRIGLPDVTYPAQQTREIMVNGHPYDETVYFGNLEGTHQPIFHIDMFITLLGRDEATDSPLVLLGSPIQAQDLMYDEVETPPEALADGFDAIQTQLQSYGYVVRRNPLPLMYLDFPPDEGNERGERRWFFASYNNCIVEVTETSKTVWMPTYGQGYGEWEPRLARVNDANEALFQELGFTVIRMPDCTMLACDAGSIHCVVNYLQRG
ncbi:hypothetical protein [Caenispirillum bisanense]|uniref:hypothetical protein n=1 Tax=Caenispirillum bisanense TaxID=414052 RepID=UPI0031DCAC76